MTHGIRRRPNAFSTSNCFNQLMRATKEKGNMSKKLFRSSYRLKAVPAKAKSTSHKTLINYLFAWNSNISLQSQIIFPFSVNQFLMRNCRTCRRCVRRTPRNDLLKCSFQRSCAVDRNPSIELFTRIVWIFNFIHARLLHKAQNGFDFFLSSLKKRKEKWKEDIISIPLTFFYNKRIYKIDTSSKIKSFFAYIFCIN